ncbi:MAG: hypothetical protein COA83_04930 [Methylophaga sp.]|nr:MAG: hypothetical protein COA83_04930 [Methylophaga sp.]
MKSETKRAATAHELLMMNLSLFHLLVPVAILSSGHIALFLTLALIASMVIIIWIARKAKQSHNSELVQAHWQLAWRRCRLLLIGYAISAVIMLLGWGLGVMQIDPKMYGILLVVFSRIAAVPTILVVLILFVLSTSSLSQARHGELPANSMRE